MNTQIRPAPTFPGRNYNVSRAGCVHKSFINMNRSTTVLEAIYPKFSRRVRWAGHVARMGEDRGLHRVLVGKPGGKRPLGRPRRRWEDNIKMDLQEVGGGRGDWMELPQDGDRWRALVDTVRNLSSINAGNFLTSCKVYC
jgi:hypothetical protein